MNLSLGPSSLPATSNRIGTQFVQNLGSAFSKRPVSGNSTYQKEVSTPTLKRCESPSLPLSPITLSSRFDCLTIAMIRTPSPVQTLDPLLIQELLGSVPTEKPLLSARKCAQFFMGLLEGPVKDACSREDHNQLVLQLDTQFDYSEEQCRQIRKGLDLMADYQQQESWGLNPNAPQYANKAALFNALYSLEVKHGYPLMAAKGLRGLFPFFSRRDRETFNVNGIEVTKPLICIGNVEIFFLNKTHDNNELGAGSFGRVRVAIQFENGENEFVAAKKMHLGSFQNFLAASREFRFGLEIAARGLCLAPIAILSYSDSGSHKAKKPNAILVMPYAGTISIKDFVGEDGELSLERIKLFANETAIFLGNLHRLGFTHGDFKTSNLLRKDGQIFLSDLGNCSRKGEDIALRRESTVGAGGTYVSPEYIAYISKRFEAIEMLGDGITYANILHGDNLEKEALAIRVNINDEKRDSWAWGSTMIKLLVQTNIIPELERYPKAEFDRLESQESFESYCHSVITWAEQTRSLLLSKTDKSPLYRALCGALDPNPDTRWDMSSILRQLESMHTVEAK